MTRKEMTGKRSLDFSGWIRINLPDSSTGFSVSDLDFVLWNWKTRKVMLLEIKTRNATVKPFQHKMWCNIHNWIKNGIAKDWTYLGFNLITFENSFFTDGKCFLNKKEITEGELKIFLSLV